MHFQGVGVATWHRVVAADGKGRKKIYAVLDNQNQEESSGLLPVIPDTVHCIC